VFNYHKPIFLTIAVTFWSVRLAGFLFYRVLQTQTDKCAPVATPKRPVHVHVTAAHIVDHRWTGPTLNLASAFCKCYAPAVSSTKYRLHQAMHLRAHVGHVCRRLEPFYAEDDEPWFTGPAKYPLKLAGFWIVQALWAFTVMLPVTVAQAAAPRASMGAWGWIGGVLFMACWVWEATGAPLLGMLCACYFQLTHESGARDRDQKTPVQPVSGKSLRSFLVRVESLCSEACAARAADFQKDIYKRKPENKGHYCDTGLYRLCQFPNYFGEIATWCAPPHHRSCCDPRDDCMQCSSASCAPFARGRRRD
jgi:Protein of unknown function (DUF1295)